MSIAEIVDPCPACMGCMPGYGPDDMVCTCGATWCEEGLVPAWVPAMRQVIGVLAELLSRPGPPDPTVQDHEAEEKA